jgi:hypothetical protein
MSTPVGVVVCEFHAFVREGSSFQMSLMEVEEVKNMVIQ